ncbi:YfhO family protein [bacterium]|nr:YfhO family protein [bacterium]
MSKKKKKKNKIKASQTAEQQPVSMNKNFWQKHPDWVAMGMLFVLLLLFFQPVMLSDQTYQSSDKMTAKSYQPFIRESISEGTYPLWNPYIFSGMPSFASLSSAPYADVAGNVINAAIWLVRRVVPLTNFTRIFLNYLLLGGFVFLLMKSWRLSTQVAFFSSVAIVFMPQMVAYTVFGHNTKLMTIVFFPVVFLCIERLLNKRNLLFFSLAGLAIGLQLLRAHVQICFYTYLAVGIYFIFWTVIHIREKQPAKSLFSGTGLLAGAVIMGVLIGSFLYLSVWEYSHYSIRGGGVTGGLDYQYATNWSFPPSEMVTFFIPSFMGFGSQTYWGQIYSSEFPLYFSLIVLILAGLALIINRNRVVWFFSILAGITLLMSFGKHFPVLYGPLFKLLPFFNKFRAPKMILIIFDFSLVVLAGFGLEGLIKASRDKLKNSMVPIQRYLIIVGSIAGLLLLVLLAGKGLYSGWVSNFLGSKYPTASPLAFQRVADQALKMARGDGVKMLFLFIFSAGAIWLAVREKISMKALPVFFCLLLVIDLWSVNKKFMDPKPETAESRHFNETPEVAYLKNQDEPCRIMTVFDAYERAPNWYMYHQIQNIYGYSAAKLRIYQELMESFGMPTEYGYKYVKTVEGQPVLKLPSEVNATQKNIHDTFLKLLNVKYLVCPVPLPDSSIRMVLPPQVQRGNAVLEFKSALPRIFFPEKAIQAREEGILKYMTSSQFDPAVTGIIEKEIPFEIQPSDSNRAEIVHYDIHNIQIEADIHTPCMMVLSEIYYPAGWKAYVDGEESQIYKTDYVLRSLFLKSGRHRIEFQFVPKMFKTGLSISAFVFALLLTGAVAGIIMRKKQRSQKPV